MERGHGKQAGSALLCGPQDSGEGQVSEGGGQQRQLQVNLGVSVAFPN